jgi:hypothetical protein
MRDDRVALRFEMIDGQLDERIVQRVVVERI